MATNAVVLTLSFHILCMFFFAFVPPSLANYNYTVLFYDEMPIDHFSYADSRTFSMRYLINKDSWNNKGPIFFYCGNEGDITLFAQNTGFMWDIAPEFHAMLVFAEHRYYGQTLPFGNESFSSIENLGFLSSEQALADYAVFLRWLKTNVSGAAESPVIAFGGSYGGMLAAWLRMKYPNTVIGALASSAPILQFTGLTPCWKYSEIVTRTFASEGVNCDKTIKKTWDAIRRMANSTAGLAWLNSKFVICPNSTLNKTDDVDTFIAMIADTWSSLAMIDYPYPTEFLAPVPGWPVREACKFLTNPDAPDDALLLALVKAIGVYYNYTQKTECLLVGMSSTPALGISGWNFQSCTEMVMPMCMNGTDMFSPSPWNLEAFANNCSEEFFGVRPREDWATTNYWGDQLEAASNIIFSNGLLDPWSGGGVLKSVGATVIALIVTDGAHHYDLRARNAVDTPSVKAIREIERGEMRKWLKLARKNKKHRVHKLTDKGWNEPRKW